MEIARCCSWWAVQLVVCCSLVMSSVEKACGFSKVRGVNLGGWLVVEGWIKPSLFDGIPNSDMLDGTKVQLKSVMLQKYICAENGGGKNVTVDRDMASSWETFRLWRVSESEFQFRCSGGQFLALSGENNLISASAGTPNATGTFYIERLQTKVHIRLVRGGYVQATSENQLTTDYQGEPGWDDNPATFEMIIAANDLHGDYQLANGYGHDKATEVLMEHWNTFVTLEDFHFLSHHGINTVRIPVGWWIAQDPEPPAPFIGGTLAALDSAFSWAQIYNLKCIIDLHAAPGSQNGMEHSASRDGSADWAISIDNVAKSLDAIDFLSSRYANHPALLGIELLNEPTTVAVPIDVLVSYYLSGYQIVRKYTSEAFVIICQRIGNADPMELYQANIGSSNLVLDLHYYDLFDTYFNKLSAANNIQFIYNRREPQIKALNSANGPLVFIGEWVNEWNASNGSQLEYQEFAKAQLEVYNTASFGWSYWTLKSAKVHWNFEWNIRNNYLSLDASHNRHISGLLLFVTVMYVFFNLQEWI